jgi:hypothetical protein
MPRDRRDGPFYVCTECHWCWTVSITGRVYVQSDWPRPSRQADSDALAAIRQANRLLASVEGLPEKLAPEWPTPDATWSQNPREARRLKMIRAAVAADYFNEGLPLAQLREEGVRLPPLGEDEANPPGSQES